MSEHPIKQKIQSIVVCDNQRVLEQYEVGEENVTSIEAVTKSGMYSDIPYVRVFKLGQAHSEFCQHQIIGTYFYREEEPDNK